MVPAQGKMFILSASKDPCILNWISVFWETLWFSCVLCLFLDPYIVFLRSDLRQQILTPRPPSQCCHHVGKMWWKWRSAFQREENPTREDICTSTNCCVVKVLWLWWAIVNRKQSHLLTEFAFVMSNIVLAFHTKQSCWEKLN